MKPLRILLLLFMTFVVLLMACGPGLYDSKRRFRSRHRYYWAQRNYESAPGVQAQREVEEARRGVEDANRLDRRDIMVFEIFMLGVLGASVYAFIRAGKSVEKIAPA
jgi:hypothetical protein